MAIRQQNVHAARWSLNGHGIGAPDLTASDNQVFGENVFSSAVQRTRLPKDVFKRLSKTLGPRRGRSTPRLADAVATAMKDWAIEKGATHYTHLFQPMTGLTAEKHDSFLAPTGDGTARRRVQRQGADPGRARRLARSPPAASAPPSRPAATPPGTRPAPPTSSRTPTAPRSSSPPPSSRWTGEALDKKTPLLRSMEALVHAGACASCKLFGNNDAAKVFTTVGPEQEYFLIDKNFYYARPDLINAGRTLFGAKPPKGQELEDQYFGAIPERVLACMARLRGASCSSSACRSRPGTTRSRPASTRSRRSSRTPTSPPTTSS